MRVLPVALVLVASLAGCVQPAAPPPPAPPPLPAPAAAPAPASSEAMVAPGVWKVDRVRCSDLLGASDDDRAAVLMFYYGYLASRAGIRVIDVNQIDRNVRRVMEVCGASPNLIVPQAFRRALGRRR